jgi:hypothetical protein
MNKVKYILLLLLFVNIDATAQMFSITSNFSSGSSTCDYSVSLPPGAASWLITSTVTGFQKAATRTRNTVAFVEFGDGTFSFLPDGPHEFFQTNLNHNVTTKVTGIYSGGGPPPHYQLAAKVSGFGNPPYKPMQILKNGARIAITPNIGSVVAEDTMIFVLTYKMAANERGKRLLFLFNDNVVSAFKQVNMNQQMESDPNTHYPSPFVRLHANEGEMAISSGSSEEIIKNIDYRYGNALAFNSLPIDTLEHNIFITLIPQQGLVSSGLSETLVKAYIVGEKRNEMGNTVLDTVSTTEKLPIFNLSHDPNYITVKPVCLTLPKAGKKLEYLVHFQNTGPGAASKVIVSVKLPGNVNVNTDIYFPANFYKILKGRLALSSSSHYSNASGDSLVFEFEKDIAADCTLDGMAPTATCMCNDSTMGDLWFTINTTNLMPDMLLAQASIVFYNNADSLPNDPIITNTAISQFRECCECKKACDPCKNKKGLWKWLFCDKCVKEKGNSGKRSRNLKNRI